MKIRPLFAWYDLWVGVYVDRERDRLYVFPLPCVGLVVDANFDPLRRFWKRVRTRFSRGVRRPCRIDCPACGGTGFVNVVDRVSCSGFAYSHLEPCPLRKGHSL